MTGDHQIERRAAAALASDASAGIGELDLILTDGAVEAVALRTKLLRVNRRLAAVLDDGHRNLETLDRARQLAGCMRGLSSRCEHLSELLRQLRARRNRLSAR
jgi:hypothetical protein